MRGWSILRTHIRIALACVLLAMIMFAPRIGVSAEGVFQGKVVSPPIDETVPPGWIFVQGQNHSLRRVEVIHAVIVFGQQVPLSKRRKCGPECLEEGQEIRVTAGQDRAGEWRASRVEILRLPIHRALVSTSKHYAVEQGNNLSATHFTKLNSTLAGAPG